MMTRSYSALLACSVLLAFFMSLAVCVDSGDLQHRDRRQAADSIDVVVVGTLKRTQHQVSGTVYAYNETILIIDQFTFDGQGAGVFVNIATKGRNRREYLANRVVVDYPSSADAAPIERAFNGERLFIQTPPGITVKDIKWLSIWCEIFGISFGEVVFPGYVANSF